MVVERTAEPSGIKTSFTILIAADERLRRQFTLSFNEAKYSILEAQTRDETLLLARSARPDLILLADNNGRLDPFETCATLTHADDVPRAPVVLLIQSEDETLINRALDSGASDYISYPIKTSVIRQRVRFLLRMRAMQADLQEKEERYRIISTSISDYAYAFRVTPDGQLVKDWHTKAFETITGFTDAQLDALGVSSRLSTLRPMGSYRLELAGGEAPRLQLSTLAGALQHLRHRHPFDLGNRLDLGWAEAVQLNFGIGCLQPA